MSIPYYVRSFAKEIIQIPQIASQNPHLGAFAPCPAASADKMAGAGRPEFPATGRGRCRFHTGTASPAWPAENSPPGTAPG